MIHIEERSDTLTVVRTKTKEIYLVGTAHVSEESAKEVSSAIDTFQPDAVSVELDKGRYDALTKGQDWSKLTIGKVLKSGKGLFMLANLALSSFQNSIGENLSPPGSEMKVAVEEAEKRNIPFFFADREVAITLKRAWGLSSLWNKLKLMSLLIGSVFSKDDLSPEDIEALKERGALGGMMDELATNLPKVKEVLIDERDRYLSHNIYHTPGEKIVAVIGAAHAPGIVAWMKKFDQEEEEGTAPETLESIEVIPPPSKVGKVLKWVIPLAVISIIAYGFISAGWETGISSFIAWVIANGVFSGIGAIISLAHPITILVTVLAAPFTSLNPTIGVGIVSGIVEGWLRKPQVEDFENLKKDTQSLRGFYRNRFTHALVVFFLTSLGSAIGTIVALPYLLRIFG